MIWRCEMSVSILLLEQIIKLFLMMFMGYILVKFKKANSEDSKGLSVVALYLVMPCVILNAFQVDYTKEKVQGLLLAFIAAILVHLILLIVTHFLGKVFRLGDVEKASVIYSNAGNLIIPIVTSVLGPEWVLYSSAFVSVQLILIWTHCNTILSGNTRFEMKKVFTNVNIIVILMGILIFLSGIRFPKIISETISSVSSLIGPVSMFVSGMIIAGIKIKEIFTNKRIYLITALRMIVFPIIMLIIFKFSGLKNMSEDGQIILLVSFLATITPTASTIVQMAQIYKKDAGYASAINVITTIVCIITMPIMVWLYML